MSEVLHRIVVGVLFLVTASCLVLTYVGIDTYLESGRSVYGDVNTATGYQWKATSCDELFRVILPSSGSYALRTRSAQLCETAKRGHVPPVGLKLLIDDARSVRGYDARTADQSSDGAMGVLVEIGANLQRRLPELEERYKPHQWEVACMWLFFPGMAAGMGCFFYARRYAPALFAIVKGRFEHIMFGRNKYSDAFDDFVKKNKKEWRSGK